MAQILVIRDPDDQRRRSVVTIATRMLEEEQHLGVTSASRGVLSVVWGVGACSPVEAHDGSLGWTLVVGDLLAGPGPERSSASEYAAAVSNGHRTVFDGLHVGVQVSATGALTIGCDLLGIFPVYYTTVGEAFLVASAPGLFRCHPLFRESLDPLALTALLLTNGLIGGLTIQTGVRRLAPGALLRVPLHGPPVEEPLYRVPVTAAHHDQPLWEWAWRLHEALKSSSRRHVVPGIPHTLLLSGGLDSRLLAGLLAEQGTPVTAVTQGLPTDTDYRCARGVARQLGFPHRLVAREGGTWGTFTRSLRWTGMNSCPGLGSDAVVQAVRSLHPRVVSGYLMDAIVGGSHIQWCYSHDRHACGYDPWFSTLNSLGIRVETLRHLLRPEVFGDSIDEILTCVRREFMENGDSWLERAWRYDLAHRQRFVIGSLLMRQAMVAWPVAPHIDQQVLATAGGIPLGALLGRIVEREIVIRYHRNLARLPLDRSDDTDDAPLDPDVRSILRSLPGRALRKAAVALRLPQRERRAWYRTFSLDGPGWVEVRRAWEAWRPAAYALFVPEALDAYLPRPGGAWPPGFKMVDTIGRKIIMGAAVLSDGHGRTFSGDGGG